VAEWWSERVAQWQSGGLTSVSKLMPSLEVVVLVDTKWSAMRGRAAGQSE
jgi:hypothetical protein